VRVRRLGLRAYCGILVALAAAAGCSTQTSGTGRLFPSGSVTYATAGSSPIGIVGIGKNSTLDNLVTRFMVASYVPNAQLAVSVGGKTVFSHAYTFTRIAASTTQRSTIMRLASNTKAWTSGALYELIKAGKVHPNDKVFRYLGITKPLPLHAKVDPRVYDITIEDMILHESGWDDAKSGYDPTFHMREIALNLGLKHEVPLVDFVRVQLAQPLQEPPGQVYAYCNFCYTVLGMVVAKASGQTYADFVAQHVAEPIGVGNVEISPTVGSRLPDEVAKYYSRYTGLSAVYVRSQAQYPYPYSGDDMVLEIAGGAAELATNADSMLAFMNKYLIWGVGTPEPGADWAREGSMPGTNTWAEQLPNGTNYAFLVNTRQFVYGRRPNAFQYLQSQIEHVLNQ